MSTNKLEDLKVLRRSPDLLNNVKIGQGFCLFDLILYVHSTIFQLCGTGLPGLNQY